MVRVLVGHAIETKMLKNIQVKQATFENVVELWEEACEVLADKDVRIPQLKAFFDVW